MLYSDRSDLPKENIRFQNFLSIESHGEKTAENDQNSYIAEKNMVSKLSKISILNVNNTNWRL